MIGVYQIELNNKYYVGSSGNIKKRWREHLCALRNNKHYNDHFQKAYNKYGEELLNFSILEVVDSLENIVRTEQKYIDELKPEYNIRKIAESNLGCPCSEEKKQRLRDANLGNKLSDETKQKLRELRLGYKISTETKNKISVANKIFYNSEKGKKMISEQNKRNGNIPPSQKGVKRTEEQKQKMREKRKIKKGERT